MLVLLAYKVLEWQGPYLRVRVSTLDGDVHLDKGFGKVYLEF